MAPAIDGPTRTMPIVLWVLRALMAALFLFAAFAKLSSMQMEVDAFAMLPVGQWFRYLVGLLELAGGIQRAYPDDFRARRDRATCGRRRGVFRPGPVPAPGLDYPIVIGAILVALIYLQRDAIRKRLGM